MHLASESAMRPELLRHAARGPILLKNVYPAPVVADARSLLFHGLANRLKHELPWVGVISENSDGFQDALRVPFFFYIKRLFVMVLQMASISVGMWVKVDCKNSMGLAFEHDGIVADTASNPEQVIVIHYAPAGLRVITETTLSQFMKMGDNARIVSEITSLSSTVIVARARSQLGRADCQHFVHRCYHGSAYSRQVFKISLFGFGFGLAIVLASIFGMTLARKTS